jgi:hypothetical protein
MDKSLFFRAVDFESGAARSFSAFASTLVSLSTSQ